MARKTDIPEPIIAEVECWDFDRGRFTRTRPGDLGDPGLELIFDYPTVYVVYARSGNDRERDGGYATYVGETNDIVKRTRQHLGPDARARDDWREFAQMAEADPSSVREYIIGNEHFNKSLTLDVENRMIQYLLGVDAVRRLSNRRTNAQGKYYTYEELDPLFSKIWRKLHRRNPELFPLESVIKDSALFKASPFHRLTREQEAAEDAVLSAVQEALDETSGEGALEDGEFGRLVLVQGAAGTGKTVLISHLFYRLSKELTLVDGSLVEGEDGEGDPEGRRVSAYVLIRHNEQRHVYNQVAKKLGLQKKADEVVLKPVSFINQHSAPRCDSEGNQRPGRDISRPCGRADIALVDEAHLLLTQGDRSYPGGKNMLLDIMRRAKVTIAVFDPDQILQTAQQWDEADLRALLLPDEGTPSLGYRDVRLTGGERFRSATVVLRKQMRMAAGERTIAWIDDLAAGRGIGPIPAGEAVKAGTPYEIKIFSSPVELYRAIRQKATEGSDAGLSRMLATYDWAYKGGRENPVDPHGSWNVEMHLDSGDHTWKMGLCPDDRLGFVEGGDDVDPTRFCHPWNYCLVPLRSSQLEEETAWAEKPGTIDEVGSTYTIQGFDLNYAGVIIGPSVKYRDGKIVFDPTASKNSQAIRKRGGVLDYSEKNLRNELNVLLKRGVHGLYLFAVDEELQRALLRAQREGGVR